jgi:hypothetical protein
MTDVSSGTGEIQSQTMAESSAQPVTQQAPQPAPEKTFRSSEVTDIVKRERQEAVDRYRRMAVEQPDYVKQKYGDLPQNQQGQLTPEDVKRLAGEAAKEHRDAWILEAQKKQVEDRVKEIVTSFEGKLSAGSKKYEDFDQTVRSTRFDRFPNVIQLANMVDNTEDVVYELSKNKTKLAGLENLANLSAEDAIEEIKALSKSIKDNERASKQRVPNEPLSQMKPSSTGTGTGEWSVKDAKRKYRG